MAKFDLERLSVLIVDDNQFVRALLGRVLRSLNVRQVLSAADGAEAIGIIKEVHTNPQKAGVQRLDLILCDWMMSPVDGVMLLKWLRRHKDSPNKFMPFIMISALSEVDKVMEARNLGANEFLTKPFSINSIAAKLTALIDKPRTYIYTKDYFGPDRRRQQLPIKGGNRRTATKENIEIIHNAKIPNAFKEDIKAYYLRVPHKLRDLVGGLGQESTPFVIDESLLEAAAEEIISMESDYADWVKDTVNSLRAAHLALKEQPKNHWKYFGIINSLAHELRGQGSTFGYPLVTQFGKSLFNYTKIKVEPDEKFIELIHAHIESIQAIVRERIKGDGGEVGRIIVQTLNTAKTKYNEQG
jgi:CheY-like chemotaxis protein